MLTIKPIKLISPFYFLFERARSTICSVKTCKSLHVARSRIKPPIGLIVDMSGDEDIITTAYLRDNFGGQHYG